MKRLSCCGSAFCSDSMFLLMRALPFGRWSAIRFAPSGPNAFQHSLGVIEAAASPSLGHRLGELLPHGFGLIGCNFFEAGDGLANGLHFIVA